MSNSIQGLSKTHNETALTHIHKKSLWVQINVNGELFTPSLNAHSDCDVRYTASEADQTGRKCFVRWETDGAGEEAEARI